MAGKKLLVADDSLTIQKVIRLALTNEGYDIHAVSDGNHALQQIATFRPDIVLIDVSLPGKSAFEVKREFNQTSDEEEIKFILMSSAFERVDETQLEEVSFHARLTKPFDPAQLRQTLTDAIQMSSTHNQEKQLGMLDFPPFPPDTSKSTHSPAALGADFDELPPPLPPEFNSGTDSFSGFQIKEAHADSLLPPIEPTEFPPLPSVHEDNDSDLWDVGMDQKRQGAPPSAHLDSDIKQLAEITLAPQSAPEFPWSIHENLPTFDFSSDEELLTPTLEPQTAAAQAIVNPKNQGSSVSPPPATTRETTNSNQASGHTPSLKPDDLEKLIQQQVHASLEKMAKAILPAIAEKVIKEEIHRLLTDAETKPH